MKETEKAIEEKNTKCQEKKTKEVKKTQAERIAEVEAAVKEKTAGKNLTHRQTVKLIMQELNKVNCTDLQLLYQKMEIYANDISWVAEESGINYYTLNKKLQGNGRFTAEEIAGLYTACDMTADEVYDIFIHPYYHFMEKILLEVYVPQN